MGIDTGLEAALAEFHGRARQRFKDYLREPVVHAPLTQIEHNTQLPLDRSSKPKGLGARRGNAKLALAFTERKTTRAARASERPESPAQRRAQRAADRAASEGAPRQKTRKNEPDDRKSDPPRENVCKSRPKNNRPKIGGGTGKRFVPWCG